MTQEDERNIRDYEIELKQYYDICERRNTRMRRIRVTVAVSALGVVIAAVLFVVMGMDSLLQSVDVTSNGIDLLQQQTQEVMTQLSSLQALQQETAAATDKFLDEVNGKLNEVLQSSAKVFRNVAYFSFDSLFRNVSQRRGILLHIHGRRRNARLRLFFLATA